MFRVASSRLLRCRRCKLQVYDLGTRRTCSKLRPGTSIQCGGELEDLGDKCPNCGSELVKKGAER